MLINLGGLEKPERSLQLQRRTPRGPVRIQMLEAVRTRAYAAPPGRARASATTSHGASLHFCLQFGGKFRALTYRHRLLAGLAHHG
eukprot:2450622-Prymnesium_polylepis.2